MERRRPSTPGVRRRRPAADTNRGEPPDRPTAYPAAPNVQGFEDAYIFVTLQFTNCRVMESQAKELELKADSTMLSEKELKRRLRASLRETGMVQHMTAQVRVLVPVLEEGVVCMIARPRRAVAKPRGHVAAWRRRRCRARERRPRVRRGRAAVSCLHEHDC